MATVVELSAVRAMLMLFPLDGLRKAAENFALAVPDRRASNTSQVKALVDAIVADLEVGALGYKKAAVNPMPMWKECRAIVLAPVTVAGTNVLPELSATLKQSISKHIAKTVDDLGGPDAIAHICAGKASSDTGHAERTAYTKRWRDRYGKPEYAYTHMRRVYADLSYSTDIEAREDLALAIEAHAFGALRALFGARAKDVIQFSDEAGRRVDKNATKAGWAVFVYLAIKIKKNVVYFYTGILHRGVRGSAKRVFGPIPLSKVQVVDAEHEGSRGQVHTQYLHLIDVRQIGVVD